MASAKQVEKALDRIVGELEHWQHKAAAKLGNNDWRRVEEYIATAKKWTLAALREAESLSNA